MAFTVRALPIPGATHGACIACGRRLPAWGGRCFCGADAPVAEAGPASAGTPPHPDGITRLAHLSDLHIGARTADGIPATDRLWMILEAARELAVDHLIVSGDVSRIGLPEELSLCARILEAGGYPPSRRTLVPGNHDIQESRDLRHFAAAFPDETYPAVRQIDPLLWVAALDSNEVPGRERSLVFERWVAPVCGRVEDKSLAVVDASLSGKPGARLLVLHHHLARHAPENLSSRMEAAFGRRRGRVLMDPVQNAAAVLALARRHNIAAIFHGHKHWFGSTGYRVGGVPVFNAGSSTLMARPRFRLCDFHKGEWIGLHEVELQV